MHRGKLEPDPRHLAQSCRACTLEPACVPWDMRPQDMARLDEIVEHMAPVRAGAHLFKADDPFKALFAVRIGAFKFFRSNGHGEEDVLGFSLPGELIGFDGIHDRRHTCSAVALTESAICVLPYSRLTELMRDVGTLREQILRVTGRNLGVSVDGNAPPDQRVAWFLVDLSGRNHVNGNPANELSVPMSWQDIASYLSLPEDAVRGVFADFEARNLVAMEHEDAIRLLNPARLELIAGVSRAATPR